MGDAMGCSAGHLQATDSQDCHYGTSLGSTVLHNLILVLARCVNASTWRASCGQRKASCGTMSRSFDGCSFWACRILLSQSIWPQNMHQDMECLAAQPPCYGHRCMGLGMQRAMHRVHCLLVCRRGRRWAIRMLEAIAFCMMRLAAARAAVSL